MPKMDRLLVISTYPWLIGFSGHGNTATMMSPNLPFFVQYPGRVAGAQLVPCATPGPMAQLPVPSGRGQGVCTARQGAASSGWYPCPAATCRTQPVPCCSRMIRRGHLHGWNEFARIRNKRAHASGAIWRTKFFMPLNVDRVHEAMELLSGEHDFRSFKGVSRTPEEEERSTVREVTEFRLRPAAPIDSDDPLYENIDLWEFHIRSRSFLYRQVRRMVSMALHAGLPDKLGDDPLSLVRCLLEKPSKNSWPGSVTVVPACGLYLMRVQYDPAHLDTNAEMPEEVAEMYEAKKKAPLQEDGDEEDVEQATAS
nr:uncharacterized protein LOC126536301 isoform X3 [Dermacentor andersoni]